MSFNAISKGAIISGTGDAQISVWSVISTRHDCPDRSVDKASRTIFKNTMAAMQTAAAALIRTRIGRASSNMSSDAKDAPTSKTINAVKNFAVATLAAVFSKTLGTAHTENAFAIL